MEMAIHRRRCFSTMSKTKLALVILVIATVVYFGTLVNYVYSQLQPGTIADHPTKSGLWISARIVENPSSYMEIEPDEYMLLAIQNLGKSVYLPSSRSGCRLFTYPPQNYDLNGRTVNGWIIKYNDNYYFFDAFYVLIWDCSTGKPIVYSGIGLTTGWIGFGVIKLKTRSKRPTLDQKHMDRMDEEG